MDDEVRRNQYIGTSVIRCWLQSAAMNYGRQQYLDDATILERRSLLLAIGHYMVHNPIVLVKSCRGSAQ